MKIQNKQSQKWSKSQVQLQSHRSVIMKLRSRIHKILDQQFSYWVQKIQKDQQYGTVTINESVLQDWVEMFKNEVLIEKRKTDQLKQVFQSDKIKNANQQKLKKIEFPKPFIKQNDLNKKIINRKDQDIIEIYQSDISSQITKWKSASYQIPEKRLKPFSSITYSQYSNSLIIIGGHKKSNPNIKSSKISQLNLQTSTFTLLNNLPYGLSSHATVSMSPHIYIIGGNKNHSIITRGCFRFNERQNQLQQISCLNHPVANANCILWKKKCIYKFGGIGQAFGTYDNSPYIQRYSINQDFWQVINPVMNQNSLVMSQIFLANSNSYICEQENQIFVFGGHNIDGKFKSNGFILKIQEHQNQQTTEHKIQQYGTFQCKQIVTNNFVFIKNKQNYVEMYVLNKDNIDLPLQYPTLHHTFS